MFVTQEERDGGKWEDVTGEFRLRTRAADIARTLNLATGRKTRVVRIEEVYDIGPAVHQAPLVSEKTAARRTARKGATN